MPTGHCRSQSAPTLGIRKNPFHINNLPISTYQTHMTPPSDNVCQPRTPVILVSQKASRSCARIDCTDYDLWAIQQVQFTTSISNTTLSSQLSESLHNYSPVHIGRPSWGRYRPPAARGRSPTAIWAVFSQTPPTHPSSLCSTASTTRFAGCSSRRFVARLCVTHYRFGALARFRHLPLCSRLISSGL